jgi:predicted nucleic acid-binding protein
MPFVLDASVAVAWCFEDERDALGDAVLESLRDDSALVPAIWPFEVANALVVAERRGRLTRSDLTRFTQLLSSLPIDIDRRTAEGIFDSVLHTAQAQNLSVYDAAYVDLAMRSGLPIATLDERLRVASEALGVTLFAVV